VVPKLGPLSGPFIHRMDQSSHRSCLVAVHRVRVLATSSEQSCEELARTKSFHIPPIGHVCGYVLTTAEGMIGVQNRTIITCDLAMYRLWIVGPPLRRAHASGMVLSV
jgi:hypothetical protein